MSSWALPGNPVTEADTFKAISFTTSAMQAVKTIAEIIRVHREIHPENHQLVLSVVCFWAVDYIIIYLFVRM